MTDAVDSAVEALFEGKIVSLNCLAPGTRARAVHLLEDKLQQYGFKTRVVDASDLLEQKPRRVLRDLADSFGEARIRVVLVRDLEDVLSGDNRSALDKVLIGIVAQDEKLDDRTRLVFVSTPRDRDLPGPSEGARERCIPFVPTWLDGAERPADLMAACGGHSHLLEAANVDDAATAVQAASTLQILAPRLVAGLRSTDQHQRLLRISRRPSLWKDEDVSLQPVVYRRKDGRAELTPCFVGAVEDLFVGSLWPSRDRSRSSVRMSVRINRETHVRWADPYLSDPSIDLNVLALFLDEVFDRCDSLERLDLLSRVPKNGGASFASEFQSEVCRRWHDRPWLPRVTWRVFDRRTRRPSEPNIDLHDRHLLLMNRAECFALPPADRLIGRRAVTNESDSVVDFRATRSVVAQTWDTSALLTLTNN